MTQPEPGSGTDVTADLDALGSADRPATNDPDAMRDDLPHDPNAATADNDDSGGAG